jgi:3-hydroxyacyl-[acyl-carrier-protein] dehydratase
MMSDPWYSISAVNVHEAGNIDFVASAGQTSPWFNGHFPGEPILPGIAQIHIVWDAIRKMAGPDRVPVITEVKRLRFRQIIRPDDNMSVTVEQDRNKKGQFAFKISVRGELACNGVIITGDTTGSATD